MGGIVEGGSGSARLVHVHLVDDHAELEHTTHFIVKILFTYNNPFDICETTLL